MVIHLDFDKAINSYVSELGEGLQSKYHEFTGFHIFDKRFAGTENYSAFNEAKKFIDFHLKFDKLEPWRFIDYYNYVAREVEFGVAVRWDRLQWGTQFFMHGESSLLGLGAREAKLYTGYMVKVLRNVFLIFDFPEDKVDKFYWLLDETEKDGRPIVSLVISVDTAGYIKNLEFFHKQANSEGDDSDDEI